MARRSECVQGRVTTLEAQAYAEFTRPHSERCGIYEY